MIKKNEHQPGIAERKSPARPPGIWQKFNFIKNRSVNGLKGKQARVSKESKIKALNERQQAELDKKLVFSLAKGKIPSLKQLKYVSRFLGRGEAWLLLICLLVLLLSLLFWSGGFYLSHLQIMPIDGGEYTEAVVGSPKYINPLYAGLSDVDNDLSSLIFSSLFKRGQHGELVNDLVASYQSDPSGKAYLLQIRDDVSWHDGEKFSVDDIIFTFQSIKDSQYDSPLRLSFSGVTIEKIDESTVKFALIEPYAAFLDLLTFGILPKHIWQQIPLQAVNLAEWNLKPIGTGPFKFKSLVKDRSGLIKSYHLVRNDDYYDNPPYLEKISFKFYSGFAEAVAALNEGLVNGLSYLPRQLKDRILIPDSYYYYQLNLPQLTAIFFNQGNNLILKDKRIRQALLMAINKERIIDDTLGHEARIIDGPILPDSFAYDSEVEKYSFDTEAAGLLLDQAGWQLSEIGDDDISQAEADLLSDDENIKQAAETKLALGAGRWRKKGNDFLAIKLTVVDNQENALIAGLISQFWRTINVKAMIEFIPASQIQAEVLKTRNFSALLYSEMVGADPDPYAFWHSSQIGQAGLNITNYANKEVDQLLEDARLTSDIETRKEKYKKFQEIISEEVPAIFLYSPAYTYVQGRKLKGYDVTNILIPRDRLANIADWYLRTGKKLIW